MEIKKIVGSNLKISRKNTKRTQQQVANIMNMKREQYSKYERGIIELNYGQIVFLCKLYDITPNDLFDF